MLRLDLLAFNTDDEYDSLFDQLWLLSRESLTTPSGMETWLEQQQMDRLIRAALSVADSPTIRALKRALAEGGIKATPDDIVQWFRSRLPSNISLLPSLVNSSPVDIGGRSEKLSSPPLDSLRIRQLPRPACWSGGWDWTPRVGGIPEIKNPPKVIGGSLLRVYQQGRRYGCCQAAIDCSCVRLEVARNDCQPASIAAGRRWPWRPYQIGGSFGRSSPGMSDSRSVYTTISPLWKLNTRRQRWPHSPQNTIG